MIADAWLSFAVHGGWQGAVGAGIVLLVVTVMRRLPATLREGLLILALVKFLVPPFISSPTGLFSLASELLPAHGFTPEAAGALARLSSPSAWVAPALLMQLVGSALVTLLALAGWVRAWRWRRSSVSAGAHLAARGETLARCVGLTRTPCIRVAPAAPAPVAVGVVRQVVLLPPSLMAALTPRELDGLLAHELAHHARHHLAIGWLRVLVCAIWWWHPLVWIVARTLRGVQEQACDEAVVRAGVLERESYCDMLIRAADAAQPTFAASAPFAERLHPLGRRLRRLLDPSAEVRLPKLATPLLLVTFALLMVPGVSPAHAPADRAASDGSAGALSTPLSIVSHETASRARTGDARATAGGIGHPRPVPTGSPSRATSLPDAEAIPLVRDAIQLAESTDTAIDQVVSTVERLVNPSAVAAGTPANTAAPQEVREHVSSQIADAMIRHGAPPDVATGVATSATRSLVRENRSFWRTLGRGVGRTFGSLFSGSGSSSPSPSPSPSKSPSRSDSPSPSPSPSSEGRY